MVRNQTVGYEWSKIGKTITEFSEILDTKMFIFQGDNDEVFICRLVKGSQICIMYSSYFYHDSSDDISFHKDKTCLSINYVQKNY